MSCLGFSVFLTCKQLQLNFCRGFHLLNPKLSRKHFQNRAPCWTKQRKQVCLNVICVSTPIDHGQRPITARVAFILRAAELASVSRKLFFFSFSALEFGNPVDHEVARMNLDNPSPPPLLSFSILWFSQEMCSWFSLFTVFACKHIDV